jgi:hypothetical protein
MQVETPMRSESSPNKGIVEPHGNEERTDDNANPEWSLLRQIQEPVVWPRIFPGL